MAFWSTEKLLLRQQKENLIDPFAEQFAKHGAYELSLGPEIIISTDPNATKQKLEAGEQFGIPPGQFALLLTEEIVNIPKTAIGFISVRFTIKRQGLINVSGFHVDPGYKGRLKFAVYNAGSKTIPLARGDRVFMIWFSDLSDATNDLYKSDTLAVNQITSQDAGYLQGEVSSPAALKKQLDDIKNDFERRIDTLDDKITTRSTVIISILSAIAASLFVGMILLVLGLYLRSEPKSAVSPGEKPKEMAEETPRQQQQSNASMPSPDQTASPISR
jgi:dCTP deaminase